jgi:hypothetical protein
LRKHDIVKGSDRTNLHAQAEATGRALPGLSSLYLPRGRAGSSARTGVRSSSRTISWWASRGDEAGGRTRTDDPALTRGVLYQLSYSGPVRSLVVGRSVGRSTCSGCMSMLIRTRMSTRLLTTAHPLPRRRSEVLYQLRLRRQRTQLSRTSAQGMRANQSSESTAAPRPSRPAARTNAYVASSFPGSCESSEPRSEYAPLSASALGAA